MVNLANQDAKQFLRNLKANQEHPSFAEAITNEKDLEKTKNYHVSLVKSGLLHEEKLKTYLEDTENEGELRKKVVILVREGLLEPSQFENFIAGYSLEEFQISKLTAAVMGLGAVGIGVGVGAIAVSAGLTLGYSILVGLAVVAVISIGYFIFHKMKAVNKINELLTMETKYFEQIFMLLPIELQDANDILTYWVKSHPASLFGELIRGKENSGKRAFVKVFRIFLINTVFMSSQEIEYFFDELKAQIKEKNLAKEITKDGKTKLHSRENLLFADPMSFGQMVNKLEKVVKKLANNRKTKETAQEKITRILMELETKILPIAPQLFDLSFRYHGNHVSNFKLSKDDINMSVGKLMFRVHNKEKFLGQMEEAINNYRKTSNKDKKPINFKEMAKNLDSLLSNTEEKSGFSIKMDAIKDIKTYLSQKEKVVKDSALVYSLKRLLLALCVSMNEHVKVDNEGGSTYQPQDYEAYSPEEQKMINHLYFLFTFFTKDKPTKKDVDNYFKFYNTVDIFKNQPEAVQAVVVNLVTLYNIAPKSDTTDVKLKKIAENKKNIFQHIFQGFLSIPEFTEVLNNAETLEAFEYTLSKLSEQNYVIPPIKGANSLISITPFYKLLKFHLKIFKMMYGEMDDKLYSRFIMKPFMLWGILEHYIKLHVGQPVPIHMIPNKSLDLKEYNIQNFQNGPSPVATETIGKVLDYIISMAEIFDYKFDENGNPVPRPNVAPGQNDVNFDLAVLNDPATFFISFIRNGIYSIAAYVDLSYILTQLQNARYLLAFFGEACIDKLYISLALERTLPGLSALHHQLEILHLSCERINELLRINETNSSLNKITFGTFSAIKERYNLFLGFQKIPKEDVDIIKDMKDDISLLYSKTKLAISEFKRLEWDSTFSFLKHESNENMKNILECYANYLDVVSENKNTDMIMNDLQELYGFYVNYNNSSNEHQEKAVLLSIQQKENLRKQSELNRLPIASDNHPEGLRSVVTDVQAKASADIKKTALAAGIGATQAAGTASLLAGIKGKQRVDDLRGEITAKAKANKENMKDAINQAQAERKLRQEELKLTLSRGSNSINELDSTISSFSQAS